MFCICQVDGVLLQVVIRGCSIIILQLWEGYVVLSVEGIGFQVFFFCLELGWVNDGDWYYVQLVLGVSGGFGYVILFFDYGQQRVEGNLGFWLYGLYLSNIIVGGIFGLVGGVVCGFWGCLQGVWLLQ